MFGLTQWSISLGSVKILTRKEQMAALQMSGGKQARKPTGLKKRKVMEVTSKILKVPFAFVKMLPIKTDKVNVLLINSYKFLSKTHIQKHVEYVS